MPKAVIFDVDGTLVAPVDLHAKTWQDAFQEFGHDVPFSDTRAPIGEGGDQLMPVFTDQADIEAFGDNLEKRHGDVLKGRYLSEIKAFPGVRALFEHLQDAGIRIALASSAKEDELETCRRIADIKDLAHKQTSSSDAEKSKPHPDIFLAAVERLDHPSPGDVAVVGETPYDAEAAGRAGLRTVGVLCGGFSEQSLCDAGCIAICRDPADLPAQLEQSPLTQETAS